MAKLRTDEEKAAILERCLELEESGGDIIGYLRSKDYITPRATWFNYQARMAGQEALRVHGRETRKTTKKRESDQHETRKGDIGA